MEKRKVNEVKDLEGEIWVDVPNYEGLYQVRNFGNVKSLSRYVNAPDKLGGRRKIKESLLKFDVCENGYFYIINELGEVFMYKNGKSVRWIKRSENIEECERIIKLHEEKNKLGKISVNGKTYRNNFVSVTDGEGNVIYKNFFVGLFFSPFSMIMAIIMTLVTYQAVRRYNKKVRNEKIKTIFSKKVIVK